MNTHHSTLFAGYAMARRMRNLMTSALAGTFFVAQVIPTYATIDNTANAVGTYNGVTTNYGSVTKNVTVSQNPALSIVKAVASGPTTTLASPGTITYTFTVTNTGNVDMTGVVPTDAGPTFSGIAGTGTWSAYTATYGGVSVAVPSALPVGATPVIFTATYTLSQLDNLEGAGVSQGLVNTAGASGNYGPGPTAYSIPGASNSTVKTAVPALPKLTISKSAAVVHTAANAGLAAGVAGLGDTVNYTYVVTNTGNVTMTNVQINDIHAGSGVGLGSPLGIGNETLTTASSAGAATSTDTTANDGIWATLGAGGVVTFTWPHIVTQSEIDHG